MKRTCFAAAIALSFAFGCAQLASAAAIAGAMGEPFNYATQNIPNASTLNGGQGFNATGTAAPNDATSNWGIAGTVLNSGTVRNITDPGLNATAIGYSPATGNKLTLDATTTPSHNIGRLLGQTIDAGTTYFSLQVSKNNDTIRTLNWAFFGGTTTAAGGTERLAVGQIGAGAGNTAGNIGLLMNNQNPAGLLPLPATPVAMGVGVAHLIVGRIDWNAAGFETVSIWVDPADVSTELAIANAYQTTSAFELTSINAVRPFAGNPAAVPTGGPTVPGVSVNFDEFRMGGTWASVTTEVIPEPTGALLVAFGSLALAAFHRAR